jgi:hypothetical protein
MFFLDLVNFQGAWARVAANAGCAGVDGETIGLYGRRFVSDGRTPKCGDLR